MKNVLTAALVLSVLCVAGIAWAGEPTGAGLEAAAVQQAPEQAPAVAAPVAAEPGSPPAWVAFLAPPVPLEAQFTSEADCELPLQGCSGNEEIYCACLQFYNPLCCYKEYCSPYLDCPQI